MASKNIKTILDSGSTGLLIDVECHLSNSLPNIVIVGFASRAIDEAKERIRGALATSHIQLPRKRITINLAPADIPKEGSSFDLPIIASIMQSAKMISVALPDKTVILGEVGLDGTVRPVRGVIGKILSGRKLGIKNYIIPAANTSQANLVPGVKLLPVNTVRELYEILTGIKPLDFYESGLDTAKYFEKTIVTGDFKNVVGQERAKRALLIAAAGHHNIMLNGPPGTGKSMLAKALPDILPPMTTEEVLEVTHLHSLSSKEFDKIVTLRPIRSPHHGSSHVSVIGGGQNPKPGEISLSHRGVLFLDEFPEFGRQVIESLRQPLEDKAITVARAKDSVKFPAHFMLVATSNPCPCGYYLSSRDCSCLPSQILRYQKKVSGPVIDRIDLYVDVEEVDHKKLLKENHGPKDLDLSEQIAEARSLQLKRSKKLNSELTNSDLKKYAQLEEKAEELLNIAAEKMKLSPRSYMRTLKVARTIADLDREDSISPAHISEAIQYRKKELVL